jgi:alginate O-acetyltransferase complex protein AlgI
LLAFNLTLAIFRVETIPGAIEFLKALFGFAPSPTTWHTIRELMQNNILAIFVVAIVFSTPAVKNSIVYFKKIFASYNNGLQLSYLLILSALFILSAMSLASGTYNPFIYFRF